jgi:adenylate kinase
VLYVETGERFREFKGGDSLTSRLTKEVMEHGGLMPEFLPVWIWADFLVKNFTGEENLVLDGLSRRVDEAPVLHSALKFYGFKKPIVVYMNVSRERAFAMMKGRGRKDDTDEYINRRLDWFDRDVMPAIEYFKHHPEYTFLDIDGGGTIEEVHRELISKIPGF